LVFIFSRIPRQGSLAKQISPLVPFDRSFDDARRTDKVHRDNVGGMLPFVAVPIRDVNIDLVRHLADASESV